MRLRKTKIALLTIALCMVFATNVFAATEWEYNDDFSYANYMMYAPLDDMTGRIQSLGDIDCFIIVSSWWTSQQVVFIPPSTGTYSVKVFSSYDLTTPIASDIARNSFGVTLNFSGVGTYYIQISGVNGTYDEFNDYKVIAYHSI